MDFASSALWAFEIVPCPSGKHRGSPLGFVDVGFVDRASGESGPEILIAQDSGEDLKEPEFEIPKHCLTWLNGLTWNPTNGVPSGQTVRFKCDRVALRSSGHVDLRGLTECADLKAQCSMTDLLLNFLWTTCLLAFTALRNLTQIHHPGTVWPVSSNKQRSKLSCSPSHKANFDCRALAGGWISSPQGH